MGVKSSLKLIIYFPILLLAILVYRISNNKGLIDLDMLHLGYYNVKGLTNLLLSNKEFRNIFYYRIGFLSILMNIFMRKNPTLHIMTKNIGGG